MTRAYEHIDPELVGNTRRFVVSELAGSSNILVHLKELGLNVSKDDPSSNAHWRG